MEILETTDYSVFKKLIGNREATRERIEHLKMSLGEDNTVPMFVYVNENMEIVDGQGRFETLKELGLPIRYIICPGATVKTTRIINSSPITWKTKDFVKSNADSGNPNYIRIQSLCDKYNCRPQVVIRAANRADLAGSVKNSLLKKGNFEFSDEDYKKADAKLQQLEQWKILFDKHKGSNTAKTAGYMFLIESGYDYKKIEEAEIAYGDVRERFDTILRFVQYLNRTYNYKKTEKNRIDFVSDFLKTPNGKVHYGHAR